MIATVDDYFTQKPTLVYTRGTQAGTFKASAATVFVNVQPYTSAGICD